MAFQYITEKTYPIYNMVKGDDWRKLVPVVQADGSTEFSFTGWNALAQVRKRKDGSLIIEFDSYDGTIEFDGGDMFLIADKDDTVDLISGEHVWDCQFQDPWGFRRTLIIPDTFEIIRGSTK